METKIDLRSTINDFRLNDKMQRDLLYWAKRLKEEKAKSQTEDQSNGRPVHMLA